jgi:hypothetical protein
MKRSGDRKRRLTAETLRRAEEPSQDLTTEAPRHGENLRRSDFSDCPITRDHPITRFPLAPAVLRNVMQIIGAALREIFDESAYDRFLQRTKATRSFDSYRAFMHERESATAQKPRCC